MSQASVRSRAAVILSRLLAQRGSLATLLIRPEEGSGGEDKEYALLQEICFGTCRWYYLLDAVLQQLLARPLKSKDLDIKCLLLTSIYQLHFMRVPDYAVINEAVSATRALKKPWAKGLTNGVLREFQRQQATLIDTVNEKPQARYSHPQWLIDRLCAAWPQQWQNMLEANNERPPMTLRVNVTRGTASDYLARLSAQDRSARRGELAPTAVYLEAPCPVESLPGFTEGAVSVQDESSQLVPGLLKLEAGLSVLDACAAPGGKTCHILESERSLSRLTALDRDDLRLNRLRENLERLKFTAEVLVADAARLDSWWDGKAFDRILLDAPCSATGIIRRHPDIRLLRCPDDVERLRLSQRELLEALWRCLKPGGLLLYSTCSVLPEENQEITGAFLSAHEEAVHEEITADWGVTCKVGRQLLPRTGNSGHDGFYFALLRKQA